MGTGERPIHTGVPGGGPTQEESKHMEDRTLDRISRSLAGATSRRQALKLLGGGIAAGALGHGWPEPGCHGASHYYTH